jgi:hypothetical protein
VNARLILFGIYLASAGCSIPLSSLPICSQDPGIMCRAPAYALDGGAVAWEHANLCPMKTDLSFRACYMRAGRIDGREVFVFLAHGANGITKP